MASYRSRAYERYSVKSAPDYERFANAYHRRLGKRVAISKNWRCLDIACGFGNFLAYLRRLGVKDFVGVDSSKDSIRVARMEFGDARLIHSEVFQFLEKCPDRYHFISLLDFVEHLRKDEVFRFFALVNRIQQLNGKVLIRTPNANGLFGMAARYNDITHESCFTPLAIRDVLKREGYRIIEIWEDGAAPGTITQTIHWILWSMVRCVIRCVNAVETGQRGDGILTRNMWVLAEKYEDPK